MRIHLSNPQTNRTRQVGATYAEVIVATAIMAVMFVSLFSGLTNGFVFTRLARENLRGTQIILERLEGIRLYNWDQIVYSNMVPANFTNYYYPLATNTQSQGIAYLGTMTITDLPSGGLTPLPSYADKMRVVTVSIIWTNGGVQRVRQISTTVAKNGVQNYIFNPTNSVIQLN